MSSAMFFNEKVFDINFMHFCHDDEICTLIKMPDVSTSYLLVSQKTKIANNAD